MLFSENISLFNHERKRQTDRQTGLLWQYRAIHCSASRGKKNIILGEINPNLTAY